MTTARSSSRSTSSSPKSTSSRTVTPGEDLAPLSDEEKARLKALEVHLDQLWDLLRQRRARRDAGLDPDGASERDPNVVERYRQ